MRTGTKTVLKMRNNVYMKIFVDIPDDFEAGLTQLTNFPTTAPKIKLVMAEVKMTAYCIPCEIII